MPAISRSYRLALKAHLERDGDAGSDAANQVGHRAVMMGLETLDLARIHETALETLIPPLQTKEARIGSIRSSSAFFADAMTPIEETHRSAKEANAHMKIIIETLTRRTDELVASNQELRGEITHRKAVEESLRTSEMTTSQLLRKSREMQEDLRHLSRRLLTVQEDERKRISRELHDVIAQTLTGINVRLAVLRSQTTANAKDLHQKIAITERLVEKSVDLVHRFARDLRPAVLDDLGLIPALESHVQAFTDRTRLPVTLETFPGVENLGSAKRTALYRIAQESLANIARHAKASRVVLRISGQKGTVLLEITDNGRGFLPEKALLAAPGKRLRLGVLGMRERAEMVGGTFNLESAPGRGTTIRVEIPLAGEMRKKSPNRKPKPPL